MRLNKKLFGKSLYKISTILFLLGYNFIPVALAAEDISNLDTEIDQSVLVTTEETSEVPNEVPLDTSEDILEKGISDPASIAEEKEISSNKVLPFRTDVLQKAVLSDSGQYTISSTSGIWTAIAGNPQHSSGIGTETVEWGTCYDYNFWGNPHPCPKQSGLGFNGTAQQSFNPGEKFLIGDLTHYNWPIYDAATGATLKVTLNFSTPALTPNPTFTYDFKIKETTNTSRLGDCVGYGTDEQITNTPCDDVITFPNSYGQEVFTIGDMKYTLVVDGFQKTYPTGSPISKFVTEENKDNKAFLVGHLSSVLIEKPAISIVKKVNGEDANTAPGIYIGQGDSVAFQYVVQNTGNVKLTNITVTDDKGVNVSCPQTELEPGTNMTCTSTGTHTATLGLYTNIGKVVGTHLGGTVTDTDPANYTGLKKIKICHATSAHDNPYNNANASMDGDVQGHDSHHGNNPPRIWYRGIVGSWDDIIPPFDYYGGHYPGKNWDEYGQSVYNNDCTIPQGTLKVNKVTIPSTDTTSFNITGTGTPAASGAPTFHNGNTGTISHGNPHTYTVSPGTYSVSETVPTGWKEVSNTCNNIVIAKGETKECTITNTKYGSLTIIKNASPSSDQVFSFTTTGTGLSDFTLVDNSDGSNPSKVFTDLLPGTYSVTEDNASGWDLTSATCSDVSPVSAINLSAGENVTCTFVNVKRGSISGHKYYDEDGKAETTNDRHPVQGWTIFIDANNNGVLDDGEASKITGADGKYTFSNIKPGTYKIVEVMKVGWVKLTGLTQTITIVAGENRENVDFVNIEYPTIQVIKKVDTNGDGTVDQENATDWEWKLDGTTYQTGIAPVSKMPGTYSLSETQKTNYHVKSLVCKNGETEIVNEVSESASITLKSGDKVVCTFTNARNLGQLIVKKVVVNDNGGNLEAKDFSFQIDGGTPIQFEEDGQNEYTKYAGLSYNIVEVEADQRGYTTTYDNCSSVTVPHNGTATCIITNTAKAPTLKLVKSVTNDNGGTLTPADWTLTAQNGEDVFNNLGNADTVHTVKAGVGYVLSESEKSGYLPEDWYCDGGTLSSNTIKLGLAENVTCTITNNDIAPKLTVIKHVDNEGNDGTKSAGDFPITVTGTNVSKPNFDGSEIGVTVTLNQGEFKVTEIEDTENYTAKYEGCEGTINVGEVKTCTITNTGIDHKPKIEVTKEADKTSVDETGENVTFTFTVKNISKVDTVEILSLVDSEFGNLTGDDDCKVGTKLAPNATCTFNLTELIKGDAIGPDHKNTFIVTVKDEEGNETSDEDDETVEFEDVKPEIEVTKTADPKSVPETGGDVTFTFVVNNTGTEKVTLNSLVDDKFGDLNGKGTCITPQEIEVGDSYTCTHTVHLSADDLVDHVNVVTATATDNDGTSVTDDDTETVKFEDVKPEIEVTKTADPKSVPETGGDVTFTFVVNNTGTEKVTLNSLVDDKFGDLNGKGTCITPQEIEVGDSYTCTHTVHLSADDLVDHVNVVTATATDNDGTSVTDDDTETVKFEDVEPEIEVTKTADPKSVPETGEDVTFTFVVNNTGTEKVTLNSLVDDKFGDLNGNGTCITPQEIEVGDSYTCTHTVHLSADDLVDHVNVVTATATDNDGTSVTDEDKATVTFEDVEPEIEVTKTADPKSIPETGGDVTFTFVVKNTGTEKVTLNSLVDDKFGDLNGNGTCITPQELEVGDNYTCTYTVHLSADDLVAHVNVVTATATDNDGTSVTDDDTETVKFEDVEPEIEVTKTADKTSVDETGEEVTFTFTVKNISKENVTIESITDSVFGELNGEHACKVGTTLIPNATCTFTVTRTISGNVGTAHKNIFTTVVKDNDGSTAEDSDDETISFKDVKPSVEVLKTAGVTEIPETGGDVTFTYKVTNTGLEEVTITSLKDDVFGDLTGDDDCKVGTVLAAGESCSFEATFTIPANTPGNPNAPTAHKNIFTAIVKDDEENEVDDEDEEEVKLTPVPSLKLVKEVVHKYNSDESITANDWTLNANGDGGFSYAGNTDVYKFVKAGVDYALSESDTHSGQFEASAWTCTGGELTGSVLKLQAEDDVVCTITNTALPATIKIYKDVVDGSTNIYSNDIFKVRIVDGGDEKEIRDTEENPLVAVFENLDAGTYNPEEVDIPNGYVSLGCEADKNTVGNGETLEFVCKNEVIDPLLEIEKSNDKQHIDQYAGDEVTYTITVTAPDDEAEGTYVLNNVVVFDIAPAGFKYLSGTWTAQKNGVNIPVPEPTYDDKGQAKWDIGDMKEGDVVVLTYKTKISLLQNPGNYPDIAWVSGKSIIDGDVLGASTVDPLTPFVGTDVTVIEPVETEEGEVLGASITLPVTGASTYLTLGALIMMILGVITLLLKPFKKLSYALLTGLMAVSFVSLLTPNRVLALDSDIKVRIMQPATPTNKSSFNVGFVALDLNNNSITVECYKDAEVTPFATFIANTGNCPVTVSASGTYTFFVKAKSASGEQKSADVTVVVDLEKPAPVIDYSKAGNVIKFKTPNDGKTKKVEIHRSTTSKYTANEGTRVHTMDVLPNTEYSWTDTTAEAGKTYYYALRTVDALGNVSTIVSDPEVVEVPTVSTSTATTTTTTTAATTGEVAGEKDTAEEGEVAGETDDVLEGEDKEVEKTEDEEEKTDIKETAKKAAGKWYIWVIAIVVIGGVAYYVRRQKRN